ncbi:hypothetical protein BJI69_18825 [Luteibacter rhizovicinus DSM 16549]|uniref:Transporter n=1 Tax=Luteibacter rhizovicinus DSM 16549 TaxID=1440763 RepID=A0A1L3EXG9_9GAMM|nr:hypothetical protein [Luteibacter rhizovicinus]APG05751.1 hypothetical protein BJI69_18825 [Luteibacter rhizovicinus DSM 16549]
MSSSRFLTVALAAAAVPASVVAAPAGAAPSDGDANFTGPLVTPAVNTLSAGMLNVEPYLIHTNARGWFDSDGDRHAQKPTLRQWQVALPMTYGLTDNISVQLTLNAARTSVDGRHSDGMRMGDSTLRVQSRLTAPKADGTGLVLAVAAAQRLATGEYHHLDNNPLNGMGTGAMRTTFAFGAQQLHWLDNGHALRWRGQLAWSPSPGRVRLRGANVYGTPDHFRGYAAPGQAWNASFAAEYVLDRRWVLVGEAIWNRESGTRLKGAADGHWAHTSPSNHALSLAPALEYHFNPKVGLIAGVQFTVGGRNATDYVAPQVALNMVF